MRITPDEQVALVRRIMHESVAPHLPPGMGATLLIFPMRSGGEEQSTQMTSYISNATRADMAAAMRSLLAKWEKQDAEKGTPS